MNVSMTTRLLAASFIVTLSIGLAMGLSQPRTQETTTVQRKSDMTANPEIAARSLWDMFQPIAYGRDPKQVFYLSKPDARNAEAPLAILVHGGNYLSGSAMDYSMGPIAHYFLQRGYRVASVDYRNLQGHDWPAPVTDVHEALQAIYRQLGHRPRDVTYIGYSAGAVTGALLLYSKQFPTLTGIDRFIGLSGLYNKEAAADDPIDSIRQQSKQRINLLEAVESIRNVKTATPALLIEGSRDYFADNYPHTPRSHAGRLARLLQEHDIPARAYWVTEPGYDDHSGPVNLWALGHAELIGEVERFLAD